MGQGKFQIVVGQGDFSQKFVGFQERLTAVEQPSQLIDVYFGCQYFVANSPNSGNIAEFCDRRLDAQTRTARDAAADNSADAPALWAQADRIVTDDAPLVPLVIPSYVTFVSKRVGNYQASAMQGVLRDQLWVRRGPSSRGPTAIHRPRDSGLRLSHTDPRLLARRRRESASSPL